MNLQTCLVNPDPVGFVAADTCTYRTHTYVPRDTLNTLQAVVTSAFSALKSTSHN